MTFLAPWCLAGLAVVPALLLWGLLAPRGRPMTVGSLLLWRRALGEGAAGRPSARLRLRDPLLWLDAVSLLLIILAVARPAWRTARPLEPVATIVIDRSASMGIEPVPGVADGGGEARWQWASGRLRQVLAELGDVPLRLVRVPGDAGVVLAAEMTAGDLASEADTLCRPALMQADVWPVVQDEAAGAPSRPVVVVTDVAPSAVLPDNVYVLACGGPAVNAGLERVAGRVEAGRWWLLVAARADADVLGPYDLAIWSEAGPEPKPIGTAREFVRPGASAERVFAFDGLPPARLAVRLAGPPDALLADDAAFFVRVLGRKVRVLVVGEPEPSVVRALEAAPYAVVVQGSVSDADPKAFDLLVAVRVPLPVGWNGPAAMVLPPRAVGPVRPAEGTVSAAWQVSADHPLAEALYLPAPRLGRTPRYHLYGGGRVLLGTTEAPLLVTWETAGVRRLAVLFGFDAETTDWTRGAGFPIFWSRAVDWLVPADRRATELVTYRPGEVVPGVGRPVRSGLGFEETEAGEGGVSFIGTGEGFQAGPGRDDSADAVQAVRASAEACRQETLAPLWPVAAGLAMLAVLLRSGVAR